MVGRRTPSRDLAGDGTLVCMSELHPINRTLLTVLANQIVRTEAAFEDLGDDVFRTEPGGDCKSILEIGRHMLMLRRFQMTLLGSSLAERVVDPDGVERIDDLLAKLASAADLLGQAIGEHDPEDWYAAPPPDQPRPGHWPDDPTIERFVRPFNDFTNHLGAIRAIRRSLGNPIERTQ